MLEISRASKGRTFGKGGYAVDPIRTIIGEGLFADGRPNKGEFASMVSRVTGLGVENLFMNPRQAIGDGLHVDGGLNAFEMAQVLPSNTGQSLESCYEDLTLPRVSLATADTLGAPRFPGIIGQAGPGGCALGL